MALSPKQKEFIQNAEHRWNIKVGATRSGKTYCDYFLIPKRIRECTGSGLIVLIGHTSATIARNILDPMRALWGSKMVGMPGQDSVELFGKKCYMLGADRISQVAKLQGAGIEYAYGDEVTTWCEEMFTMLKSRLDKPDSRFDGTCNPDTPGHWFKTFLDSGADIYCQSYTIDDNPFLTPFFVSELKKEYTGTVFYDRYILGKWCAAEGAVYTSFAADPDRYLIHRDDGLLRDLTKIVIGVDFGGTKSGTAFVAAGFRKGYDSVVVLASERHTGEITSDRLGELFCSFCERIAAGYRWEPVINANCDNAESVLIRSLRAEVQKRGIPVNVRGALKRPVNDRIRLTLRLMAQKRLFLTEDSSSLSEALRTAVWNPKVLCDERLDDGTSDIDSLDAFEYCIERDESALLRI